MILVTRPFLICILLHLEQLRSSQKLAHFEELAKVCVTAAEQSLGVVNAMAANRLLSSLMLFDFYFTLDLLQIFVIASSIQGREQHQGHASTCFTILQSLSARGHQRRLLPEIVFQLQNLGLPTNSRQVLPVLEPIQFPNTCDNDSFAIDTYEMYADSHNDMVAWICYHPYESA